MKRLILVAVLLAAFMPGASRAGACSPLDCSPSQFTLARGSMLAVRNGVDKPLRVIDLRTGTTRWRLPAGVVSGNVLVHQHGSLLTWYSLTTGERLRDAVVQQHGAFQLVGVAQDGWQAVLSRTQQRSTTFAVVSPTAQRMVKLGGNRWTFDALSGDNLFLVRYLKHGYQIRLMHLRSGALDEAPLQDPKASSTIWGSPWSRLSSANRRYLFTLYVGPNGGAMVHVLDTRDATARCVDLPGTGSWDSAATWTMVLDPDGRHLWAVSAGYGRVANIDIQSRKVIDAYRFRVNSWNTATATAVMSPDGERIAFTDANHIWFLVLAKRRIVTGPTHVAIAMAYSPDQKHLWVLGQRSRVSSLRPR
ncbi:MAG: hypothetical protein JWO17_3169 [Actinomycetia bacterium]|nr:hypothetical protein [Actinomycetes bacterium]